MACGLEAPGHNCGGGWGLRARTVPSRCLRRLGPRVPTSLLGPSVGTMEDLAARYRGTCSLCCQPQRAHQSLAHKRREGRGREREGEMDSSGVTAKGDREEGCRGQRGREGLGLSQGSSQDRGQQKATPVSSVGPPRDAHRHWEPGPQACLRPRPKHTLPQLTGGPHPGPGPGALQLTAVSVHTPTVASAAVALGGHIVPMLVTLGHKEPQGQGSL